jgi:arsenate reductase (glutaredoxin)
MLAFGFLIFAEELMTVSMYGIKNCDTIKKARRWLDEHSVAYTFIDYNAAGIDSAKLQAWSKLVGWDKLLNRSGTTFKKLADSERADLDEAKAIRLMTAQPSMIKRPVLELGRTVVVGFNPEMYEQLLVQA